MSIILGCLMISLAISFSALGIVVTLENIEKALRDKE